MLNKAPIFAALLILVSAISSCSIYPENPLIALGSKEKRIANTWRVTYASDEDGTEVTAQSADDRYIFSEDGTAEWKTTFTGVDITLTGEWDLLDDGATLQTSLQYTLLGVTYTQTERFNIQKLTEDELWLEDADDNDIQIKLTTF